MSTAHTATPPPRLLALGDSAWTLELGSGIDPAIHARVMALAEQVARARQTEALLACVNDVVPTFRSLTVHFDPLTADAPALGERLLALTRAGGQATHHGRHWRLPVCFDPEFAPDLPRLAQARKLSQTEVIERLLGCTLRVYMIGFLPGFAYMGGLPAELAMPRLASPRQRVPAHSVAVTGQMCAVYPWESPGGWNLIGRTPLALFDLAQAPEVAMLSAGDTVRWRAVSRQEHDELARQIETGQIGRAHFLAPEAHP